MDSTKLRFFAPCPQGLEGVLEQELHDLGVPMTTKTEGGIAFLAPWATMYWVNLKSHLASRVLWEVGQAPYLSEDDVYRAAYSLPWPDWFTSSQTIKVKVSARRCPLTSLDFITLRIKDAVCDKFMAVRHKRPDVDTKHPSIKIDAFLDASTVTFYLDTSGDPLFKRGHRVLSVEAPLRENLAAGLLRLAGWAPNEVLLDPMCGSGTIPLEAALMGRKIAPGQSRSFGFERLIVHDPKRWGHLREASRIKQLATVPAAIYASDWDPAAVKIAQRIFQGAGVGIDIRLRQSDVLDLEAPAERGVIIINPPYGVRLSKPEELDQFYPKLGDWLKQRFSGWRAYIFTGDLRVPKLIGLAPSKRIPLFNGPLECRLYEFLIMSGSMRKTMAPPDSTA
ncbi:MAG: class I SAM-dependent RNA methyltransferase [Nitrospira sp.]|nr:class I SAM-dependent RNA methyltransferase [Nitrospira sp.]GDX89907.1 RNA methyltransferase [Nitrospirota bacterium]MBP0120891.1 class I SAM-dependent RNA methyltransferase [Nitrospira sp.]MBP0124683.1 class I SAM-dependent RNA methyltransferase [Nitrospira sp.]MBP0127631.1 class I SAM-dependent RNA methyltransferase [Nitrospira sp.]